MYISGGRKLKVESRLRLMKEDTTLYHLFKCFKDRVSAAAGRRYETGYRPITAADLLLCALPLFEVMRRTGKLDLTRDREKKFGSANPAFCDVELDITKSGIPT